MVRVSLGSSDTVKKNPENKCFLLMFYRKEILCFFTFELSFPWKIKILHFGFPIKSGFGSYLLSWKYVYYLFNYNNLLKLFSQISKTFNALSYFHLLVCSPGLKITSHYAKWPLIQFQSPSLFFHQFVQLKQKLSVLAYRSSCDVIDFEPDFVWNRIRIVIYLTFSIRIHHPM